jgi:molybdate transport system permease protein
MGFSATALRPRSGLGGAPVAAEPLTSVPIVSAVATEPPRLEGDLRVRLKKRLGSFDLDIAWAPQARRLAILGASGSGKSLSLRMIAGIERAAIWRW